MIEQLKAHTSCPCCVRAPLQKSSTRAQAVNAVNPCDGVTKGLLPDKLSVVVDGFLLVERSVVRHREFLQLRRGTQRGKYAHTPFAHYDHSPLLQAYLLDEDHVK